MGASKLIYIHITYMPIMKIPGDRRMITEIHRINPVSGKLMKLKTMRAIVKKPPKLATMGTTISPAFSRMATLAAAKATLWFS